MKTIHSTDQAPAAIGPYSQAVEVKGLVFCSGQIPLTPTGELVTGDVRVQTEQVMANIEGLLGSMGLGFEDVVKTTIFLSSMDHFAAVNEVYGARFLNAPPARSTVAVLGLPKGVDIEIEVICARS
jgi:2-iminobutanoate/2-iminopropanoate deaminase